MKLTQENGLYTCFRLFWILLDSTWKERKKEKKNQSSCCWLPRVYWGKYLCAKIVQVYVSHEQFIHPLLCLDGRGSISYIYKIRYCEALLLKYFVLWIRRRITGELIPASWLTVNIILYPRLPEIAATKRCEWSHNRNRGQGWKQNQRAPQKLLKDEVV